MLRFRQMRNLQKLAALHCSTSNHFNQQCALISGIVLRERRTAAFIE